MSISTVWILKFVQQCYVKWFWTLSSLGAPVHYPCNQSREQSKGNADDVELLLRYKLGRIAKTKKLLT